MSASAKTLILTAISILMTASTTYSQNFWTSFGSLRGQDNSVTALSVLPNGSIIEGTSYGNIYRSTDNGNSWQQVGSYNTSPPPPTPAKCLLSINSDTVYAAPGNGVTHSTDGGNTWASLSLSGIDVRTLCIDSSGIAYAAALDGIYRSSDNGANWSKVNGAWGVSQIGLTPGGAIVAVTDSDYVLRSTDEGNSWTKNIAISGYFSTIKSMAICSDGRIFVGTSMDGIWLSSDQGVTWQVFSPPMPDGAMTIVSLATNTRGDLFAGTFNGNVYLLSKGSSSWTTINSGLPSAGAQVNTFALDSKGYLYAATNNGIFRTSISTLGAIALNTGAVNTTVNSTLLTGYVNPKGLSTTVRFQYGTTASYGNLADASQSPISGDSSVMVSSSISGLAPNTVYHYDIFAGNAIVTAASVDTTFVTLPLPPTLSSPADSSQGASLVSTLSWNSLSGTASATYQLQISTDSLFSNVIVDNSTITSTSIQVTLIAATRYYWRVQAINVSGKSGFSVRRTFVTLVTPPTNLAPISGNREITLSWTASTAPHVVKYRIYRGTSQAATPLYDSCTTTSFVDSGLANGTDYYYKVTAVDSLYGESGFSNEVNSSPFNKPPVAASLGNVSLLNTGRVLTNSETFSSSGSTDPDGTVDSTLWFVNYQRVGTQPTLTYNFGPGTSRVTLVVVDNQGARDSSVAYVNRAAFVKTLGGVVTSGLSMVGSNVLYAIATGDAVYRLDSNETTVYKLQVSGSSGSSCSIAYDSTVYISSSDNNLYAFSKNATSVWPALPLGGNTSATPTVDSTLQRVYIGVSNNNFLGINRLTGAVVWNFFTSSPISNSAVISSDRRLVFPTSDGTVYGVDLEASSDPTAPTWTLSLPDASPTSPAIDQYGYFYFGTAAGNLYAVSMKRGEQASRLWNLHLGGQLLAAPVIDANGILYIGSTDSTMYAVNLSSKSIAWKLKTNGSIRYSAAISPAGDIYFDNDAGELYCIDNAGNVRWSFIDPGDGLQVIGPILYNNGMVYAGAGTKSIIALYDGNGNQSSASRVSSVSTPIWGTFQGNNQRTGIQSIQIVSSVSNDNAKLPTSYALYANYPNPFNPSTTISYDIPKYTRVTLIIYDVLGRQVRELVNGEKSPGRYQATFNASDLPSGVYFYRLDAGNYSKTKKLVLLK